MKIVLLAGWSQAGKDTLGSRLVAEHEFKRFAFADPVKDAAAELYGFDRRLADTQEGKATTVQPRNWLMPAGRTVRDWIIQVGEERKKVHGAGIWAEKIAERIMAAPTFRGRYVITDWRFPEELVALQARLPSTAEFYPARLVRPGQRVSPVGSMTEYALCGFPMPAYNSAEAADWEALKAYVGL